MAVRLVKLFLPDGEPEEVAAALDEDAVVGVWTQRMDDGVLEATVLPKVEANEDVLDRLEQRFSSRQGYRLILLPVAVSLPHPERDEMEEELASEPSTETKGTRINREELYSDAVNGSRLDSVYLVLVLLSTIVAAAGMIRSDPAVIIGAMVIAPLLGPNVALSLATTLGDAVLARRAAITAAVAAALALAFSLLVGRMFNNLLVNPEIASRTNVDLSDLAIALAAGAAGAISFTTGVPAALIGVMVAVALLPPLVSFGMLLGAGLIAPALGAMLLFSANVICVNLAGVATFLAQGIRPVGWSDKKLARRATAASIALWLTLLLALVAIIVIADPATRLQLTLPDN